MRGRALHWAQWGWGSAEDIRAERVRRSSNPFDRHLGVMWLSYRVINVIRCTCHEDCKKACGEYLYKRTCNRGCLVSYNEYSSSKDGEGCVSS